MARDNRNVQSVKDSLAKTTPVLDKVEVESLVKAFTGLLLAKVRGGSISAGAAPQHDLSANANRIVGHCPEPLSSAVAPDPCATQRGSDMRHAQSINKNVAVAIEQHDSETALMTHATKSESYAKRGLLSACARLCKNQGRTACPVCHGEGHEQHQQRVNKTHRGNQPREITS
jgi:hypothetical protein